MNLSSYLEPRSEDQPSGENLEYDPAFTDLEIAAQPGEERQMGDEVVAAEEQDWAEVETKALAVMEKSHDLRAAIYLGEAVLHTKGLPAFATTLNYAKSLLEDFWDTCHPELDEDDGDATMRINAVRGLASTDRMVRALRRTGLTDSRMFGRMTLRHLDVVDGRINMPADLDDIPDANGVAAAFKDTDDEVLAANAEAVSAALEDVGAIDAVFTDKTPGEGPNLDPLIEALKSIRQALAKYADVGEVAAEDVADTSAPAAAPAVAGGAGGVAPAGGGAINSPDDVTRMLDRIMDYYARCEPSSPLPILLERAKRLVNADFLTIIEDMAKEGLDEVRQIGGLKTDDDDHGF
ncbi:type VI secretion system protein TssA [Ruegeria lacuscaerulensis]|uniref:type VI secretion system protein TssA n=1 Tax=Ruegeria lacuscaerulensis TaxID=55218 RepID=UPI00147F7356|nr:type VI secretion system protein TssA [Ruegeria lacuscaerulensis]